MLALSFVSALASFTLSLRGFEGVSFTRRMADIHADQAVQGTNDDATLSKWCGGALASAPSLPLTRGPPAPACSWATGATPLLPCLCPGRSGGRQSSTEARRRGARAACLLLTAALSRVQATTCAGQPSDSSPSSFWPLARSRANLRLPNRHAVRHQPVAVRSPSFRCSLLAQASTPPSLALLQPGWRRRSSWRSTFQRCVRLSALAVPRRAAHALRSGHAAQGGHHCTPGGVAQLAWRQRVRGCGCRHRRFRPLRAAAGGPPASRPGCSRRERCRIGSCQAYIGAAGMRDGVS